MIKMILFDLDGTLLPMDQDLFIDTYFGKLAKKLEPYGYDPALMIKSIWLGSYAMIKNDGSCTNEDVFWRSMRQTHGERIMEQLKVFDEFYEKDFPSVREVVGYNEKAVSLVRSLPSRGFRVALATNPFFPRLATETRIAWAGLSPSDFELYTTYEDIGYCKPSLGYYREVCRRLGVDGSECLMVGNDVADDMVAEALGMKVFLLTDHLINSKGADISRYMQGSFDELDAYISGSLSTS